ncbi:MAG: glycoside hydrolase family 43 protein [Treponema sp.]|jgi:GH43 family beta-xylosidase|nr:glycoside hydrolase family 43 protein [Treponema sp.]
MLHIEDIHIRDPFVVPSDGRYYLFGSTDKDIWRSPGVGFDMYVGTGSLDEFDGPFPAFRPPDGFWSAKNFWAPEVHPHRGAYYMFATFLPKKGRRGTAVLKSESGIMGPYLPWSLNAQGAPGNVTPAEWECLDGTFFMEEGKPWMVFCHEWRQVGDGEICAMPLTEDLMQAAGEPRLLFRSSEAAWSYELPARAPGSYVTDGPFMHRAQDGTLLMLWSAFGKEGNYCIGAARSEDGTLLGRWKQDIDPLYAADGGHGMVFRDFDGTLRLAIHSPNSHSYERAFFIAVTETNNTLRVSQNPVVNSRR